MVNVSNIFRNPKRSNLDDLVADFVKLGLTEAQVHEILINRQVPHAFAVRKFVFGLKRTVDTWTQNVQEDLRVLKKDSYRLRQSGAPVEEVNNAYRDYNKAKGRMDILWRVGKALDRILHPHNVTTDEATYFNDCFRGYLAYALKYENMGETERAAFNYAVHLIEGQIDFLKVFEEK